PPTDIEELRMENTSLKQQIVKLEQDVRSLSARLSDAEAKYMAEKDRADRAEEAARVAAQSAAISARGSSDEAMTAYEAALQTFNSKAYDDAVSRFQALLDSGVGGELADNCHYWIGESNYGKKNYQEAIKHFEMVFEFDKSEKLADAHFMLAQCLERTGNKQRAKTEYETVVNDFPMSGNVGRARERSARL
ncbi:MAG TPA: tetratricopeptide repeat protein, partial [Bacteroidota bacterium]